MRTHARAAQLVFTVVISAGCPAAVGPSDMAIDLNARVDLNIGKADLATPPQCSPPDCWALAGPPGGPGGTTNSYSVAVAANGDVIVAGGYANQITFGNNTIQNVDASNKTADIFVAKFKADGTLVWLKSFGDKLPLAKDNMGNPIAGYQTALGVAVDALNNIYLTGWCAGSLDFGGSLVLPCATVNVFNDRADIFIAKLDTNGSAVHASQIGNGNGDTAGFGIAVGAGVYVVGQVHSNGANFGAPNGVKQPMSSGCDRVLTPQGYSDGFLAMFDTDLNCKFVRQLTVTGPTGTRIVGRAWAVAATGGNAVITGYFDATDSQGQQQFNAKIDLGCPGGPLDRQNSPRSIFVAAFDGALACQWNKMYVSDRYLHSQSITADPNGVAKDILVSGIFGTDKAPVDFGCGVNMGLSDSTGESGFVVKLNVTNGNVACAWNTALGKEDGWARGVARDPAGNALVTGYLSGQVAVDFGNGCGSMQPGGALDVFVAKLGTTNGQCVCSSRFGDDKNQWGQAIASHTLDTSKVVIVGGFTGKLNLGPAPFDSVGPTQVYVAKINACAVPQPQ